MQACWRAKKWVEFIKMREVLKVGIGLADI